MMGLWALLSARTNDVALEGMWAVDVPCWQLHFRV